MKRVLTYSSTSAFKECRRKYQYSYVDEIKPIAEPRPLRFGSAFHLALEMYYLGETPGDILQAVDKYFDDGPADLSDDDLTKQAEDREMVKAIFTRYAERYGAENFVPIMVEQSGEVPILNPKTGRPSNNWSLKFKVDGIIRDAAGLHWIIEHKTTSAITSQYIKALTMDTQCVAYIDAVRRAFGINVVGVLYNVVLKDAPKPPNVNKNGSLSMAKNQNTTAELFRAAIAENGFNESDYAEHLAWLESNQKQFFYREWLTFPDELIREWQQEIWQIARDVRSCEKEKHWYKNTSQCVKYGSCRFFDICAAIDRQSIIDMNFVKKAKNHEEIDDKASGF